jgi:hypothetical protein
MGETITLKPTWFYLHQDREKGSDLIYLHLSSFGKSVILTDRNL